MKKISDQNLVVSDLPENKPENLNVIDEVTPPKDPSDNMPKDYKDDFFKQKQRMKDAEVRADAAEARALAYEEKDNIAKGNYQVIIDTQKQTIEQLKTDAKVSRDKEKLKKFNESLESRAKQMGFTKPNQILKFISDKDLEILKIDGEMNINEAGLDIAFTNIKKDWGELFKPKEVIIADGIPKTNLNQTVVKSAKDMTSKERLAMARKQIK